MHESPARLTIAVNRQARAGDADLAEVVEALTSELGPAHVLDIEDPSELSAQLEACCTDGVERVVVAGGDGTINSALPALIGAKRPLGILPLGTANDFARTLGIPAEPEAAASIILAGRTRRVDVGSVNGRYFVNAAGLGFSTSLTQELTPWIKSTFGPLAYAIGVARRWRRTRPFSVSIRGDGAASRRKVIQVTVANGRFYGGGMTAHEDSRIDDGCLDVVMVLPRPWWRHGASVISLKRGVYKEDAPVVAERLAAFELSTDLPKSIATDGEPSTTTPASFSVLPGALEVFAP